MNQLKSLILKKTKLCIGLMSGTSMDGVDAALVRITGSGLKSKIEAIDGITYPYPKGLKEELTKYISSDSIELSALSQLNFLIGEIFADAVIDLVKKTGYDSSDIDLIGSHGQTIWHNPVRRNLHGRQIGSTLQIGEPSVINARTGIVTVADFRVKDVAFGGGGAPLIPYFDYLIFQSKSENRGILNIGGIANITVIRKNSQVYDTIAFDTGPGNMIIDELMRILFDREMDTNGTVAQMTKPDGKLLEHLMGHSFITLNPPKSTGREVFGKKYVNKILNLGGNRNLKSAVIVSTAVEFTVSSVVKNYELFIKPVCSLDRLIVSGGGARNSEIMKRLKERLTGVTVETLDQSKDFDLPSDYKEAVAFAFFANEAVAGNPANIPGVTGARSPAILGKIIM